MSKVRETTGEGIEKTFAVNVLAPFLLTNLLLNLLKKSSEARIINIASNSHHLNAQPDFEDLQLQQNYHPLKAYGNSKLFLIWNTQHLATLLQKQQIHQVTAYTLHPGAVATGFGTRSNLGPLLNTLVKLAHPLFKSPEAGADTLIFLATAPVLPGRSGDYFVNRKPVKAAIKYYTAAREQLVWDYCSGITQ
jgi:NAD(P)-dependent dehydrogenase (short-subunit alcohol dehydrogenase family)